MQNTKKKCGGSPEKLKVRFYTSQRFILPFHLEYRYNSDFLDNLENTIIKSYTVKIGTTYKDVLIRF